MKYEMISDYKISSNATIAFKIYNTQIWIPDIIIDLFDGTTVTTIFWGFFTNGFTGSVITMSDGILFVINRPTSDPNYKQGIKYQLRVSGVSI